MLKLPPDASTVLDVYRRKTKNGAVTMKSEFLGVASCHAHE
jgi:hypothetical protein